ncbi:3-dehydroquinate synthase [bioreactor metagenome]|uniref:3-dehydroquinate synthase n=1 Tax=bioreactor metagenome TaxID=1076179 RepID=A0A644YUB4_9ZZZZ
MDVKTVRIRAGNGYTVTVGGGLLPSFGALLKEAAGPCRVAVVTDTNVEGLYLEPVRAVLETAGFEVCTFVFPAGEGSKNVNTLSGILEFLAENRLTRADCVTALGGGVVGDVTGFAAGCFLRGVRYVQIPTTLLAAVDSSVGGKTAMDLKAGKNLAGVFHQPSAVLCDTDFLNTLSSETFADGAAEAIKTGVLAGEALFSVFETGDVRSRIPEIVAECVAFKGRIVEADEFDASVRQTLNLGHTVGHAIEVCSGYTVTHGHAVAMGMAVIARASARLGLCERGVAECIIKTLARNGLPVSAPYTLPELADAALSDKKRSGDTISLVIPRRIGDCVLKKTPINELAAIIGAGMEDLPCR